MLAQQRRDAVRRRPVGEQHRRRADRQRKSHGVAEAIGEKQFRHRIADVAFLDAGDRRAVKIGGEFQAGVDMHRAFRLAGRARGVEPEGDVVAGGRRGVSVGLGRLEQVIEFLMTLSVVAGDDDMLEIGAVLDDLFEFRIKHVGNDQGFRAAVGQHVAVVVLGHQRVDRHGDDAGLEAPEKRRRPVDGVGERQQHALLAVDAERAQRGAKPRHALGKLRRRSARRARRYRQALLARPASRLCCSTSAAKL